jgi:hypothetical protein
MENKDKCRTPGSVLGEDLVAFITKGRLRWLGHVERIEDNRVSK